MIRLACADDLDAVDAIYDAILTLEEARPVSFTNWQRGKYPTLDHARRAMEEHTLWLAGEDGKYYGTFILNGIQLPEYAQIPWQFQAPPDQVAVIHTLMVHPDWSGRGKGRELVAFCEEESRRQGKSVIRLDTPEGNTPANLMYARLGGLLGMRFFHHKTRHWYFRWGFPLLLVVQLLLVVLALRQAA